MTKHAGFRCCLLILGISAGPHLVHAQYAPVSWVQIVAGRSGGLNTHDTTQGVAADASGNVFATGGFRGSFDFGGGSLTSSGSDDIFVVKYGGSSGSHLWSKQLGSSSVDDDGNDAAADANGDVIVVGTFGGSVDFGSGIPLSSAGSNDVFVAKYAGSNGSHLWSKRFGNSSYNSGFRLALDSSGNVYFIANIGGCFVAKLNGSNGATAWSESFSGALPFDVASDSDGSLVVTGFFSSSVNFGGASLSSAGSTDVFLAKFSGSDGSHVWSKRFGGTSDDIGRGLALDGSSNIILTGSFKETVNFGGSSLSASGGTETDIFLARFTPYGTHRWSMAFGQPITRLGELGERIAVRNGQTIVMAGQFDATVNFGGGPLAAAYYPPDGEEDMVIAAYDTTATHQWSMNVGGMAACGGSTTDGYQAPRDLAFDSSGALLVAGALDGPPTDFGAGPVDVGFQCNVSPYPDDGFVAKYFVPSASVSDSNLLTCPQGDLESIAATMDFDNSISIGTISASNIILNGPLSTVNLFGTRAPTASGNATTGNGYTATVTAGQIGGSSHGAKVPFNLRINDAIGRLYLSVFAQVMSPDFEGNGTVSSTDLDTLQATYSKCPGQSGYRPWANFVETAQTGCITVADLSFWATHYGHAASGGALYTFDSSDPSMETSVALGEVQGDPYRFVTTLEHSEATRACVFQISLGGSLVLEHWQTNHSSFSGDIVAEMRGAVLWLTIITLGGTSVTGDGIELGELTLRPVSKALSTADAGFAMLSGTIITTKGTFAARPGQLPQPGDSTGKRTVYANRLMGNVPNPFNPTTTIQFSSASSTRGQLKIYSATGALIRTLLNGTVAAGEHSVEWDGRDNNGQSVVSGVYFCQLRLGSFTDKKKMVLIK